MSDTVLPQSPVQKPSLWRSALKAALITLWTMVLVWLLLEVFMRVGFDLLPASTQAVVQHVRVVPWDDAHIIPVLPFEGSREFHARIPPDLDDYKVHWGDTRFTFDTISLWGGSEGFRTRKPQWPMDVVAVGDSFTFCWTDFEDCWVQQLNDLFGLHVMNLGVPGTGSMAHRNVMAAYAPPMEPAVVAWQWFGNDYKDDYDFAVMRGEMPQPLDVPPIQGEAMPDYGTMAEYSTVYRWLRDWIDKKLNPPEDKPAEYIPTINGREVALNTTWLSHDLRYESVAFGYAETIRAFEEAHAVLEDAGHGTELVIILIPTKEEIYAQHVPDFLDADYVAMLAEGRLKLLDECAAHGWRCLDMTDHFMAAVADGQTVYNALDFHLDAVGNRIVAEVLGEYLIAEGLVERRGT